MNEFDCGFEPRHVGQHFQAPVSLRRRLRYLIDRYLLRRPVDPPGLYIIVEVGDYSAVLEPAYLCYHCKRIVPWSFGCADDVPHVCDDCYAAAHCKICGAAPGQACDGGLHG